MDGDEYIVAESPRHIAGKLERSGRRTNSVELNGASRRCSKRSGRETAASSFNGNGYSDAWHKEAERRGLPNLRSCVEALPLLGSKEAIEAVRQVRGC